MQAVREVIAKHGKETKPVAIVKFARTEHGATLNADVASNYKSAVLRELGLGGRRRGKKRGPKPGWKTAVGNGAPKGQRVSLEDIAAVKKLVDQLGAEKVRELARVLGH
jgi:hypothetical protein